MTNKFYESIANYYDHIFPLNQQQLRFVNQSFPNARDFSLLDIGCGTGGLSIELGTLFNKATAIDLDKAMIEKARQKGDASVKFMAMDMLKIAMEFGSGKFDAVVCFGNTLVHLDGSDSIQDFFNQAYQILSTNGKLLFQIINYDRIINQNITSLPTIENDIIRFSRKYHYNSSAGLIDFNTCLMIKNTGKELKNSVKLYPLQKAQIDEMLGKAGFSGWSFYGNFKREDLSENSQPLIVEAVR